MIAVLFLNILIVSFVVFVHYESLYFLALITPKIKVSHRYRILVAVFGCLIAHAIEIWFFAFAYYFMNRAEGWGKLEGNFNGTLMDSGYFSFTVFTTLGFGDIQPIGHLRYLTGVESLTGLILIAWTASFLYFQMQQDWSYRGSD